jgi:hypothetical protein
MFVNDINILLLFGNELITLILSFIFLFFYFDVVLVIEEDIWKYY